MKTPIRNNNRISTLFFDVGGVCLTDGWETESRQKAAKHFSLDFIEMNRRHHRLFDRFQCGKISLHDYLTEVVFYKKRVFSKVKFMRFIESESKPYKSTLDILKKIKAKDKYLLAVLSNESAELNKFRIKKFKLQDYFTHFFSSCFLGCKKPSSRIYEIALNVTQKIPQECLFIDDREENIKAARELHINTIHLVHTEQLSEELRAYGIEY